MGRIKTKKQQDWKLRHRHCKMTMVPKLLDPEIMAVGQEVKAIWTCSQCGFEKPADAIEVLRIYNSVDWKSMMKKHELKQQLNKSSKRDLPTM